MKFVNQFSSEQFFFIQLMFAKFIVFKNVNDSIKKWKCYVLYALFNFFFFINIFSRFLLLLKYFLLLFLFFCSMMCNRYKLYWTEAQPYWIVTLGKQVYYHLHYECKCFSQFSKLVIFHLQSLATTTKNNIFFCYTIF